MIVEMLWGFGVGESLVEAWDKCKRNKKAPDLDISIAEPWHEKIPQPGRPQPCALKPQALQSQTVNLRSNPQPKKPS